MGRMQDALKKAAEERERRRLMEEPRPPPPPAPTARLPRLRPRWPTSLRRRRAPSPAPEQPRSSRASSRGRADSRVHAGSGTGVDERLVVFHAPSDARAEDLRKVRANLLALDPRPRTIMVDERRARRGQEPARREPRVDAPRDGGARGPSRRREPPATPSSPSILGARPSPGLCRRHRAERRGDRRRDHRHRDPATQAASRGHRRRRGGAPAPARRAQGHPRSRPRPLRVRRRRHARVVRLRRRGADVRTTSTACWSSSTSGGGRRKATHRPRSTRSKAPRARLLGTVIVTGT